MKLLKLERGNTTSQSVAI